MTDPEKSKYRVIVYRMELTLKGEEAWKRLYDVRGPATSTQDALEKVARLAPKDPKAVEPEPNPIRKARDRKTPRHPDIVVGTGGLNAMQVMSRVRKRMRTAGVPASEIREFERQIHPNGMVSFPERTEVMRIVRQWITVKGPATK